MLPALLGTAHKKWRKAVNKIGERAGLTKGPNMRR